MKSQDCIFCKIVKGKIPASKIYEDDKVLAFLDIAPTNKGHALVLPKEHHEILTDVPDDLLRPLFSKVKDIAKAQSQALGAEGYNVVVNNKKVSGQLVPHLHVHVIPRFSDDGIKLHIKQGKYKPGEMQKFAEKIKKFL